MADCSDDQNPLECPICLQLLTDPVTTACGHSFCMNCIKKFWDVDDQKGVYSCPQCRQIFTQRPTLNRSTVLNELVKKLKKEAPEEESFSPLLCSVGSGDVECDICIGTKRKAVKFCQMCVAFYCEYHIQSHFTSAALKRHKLVNALPHLLEQICPQHDKPLELFCCNKLICTQCAFTEHQSHRISTPATSRKTIESQLRSNQVSIQRERDNREKKVQELRQSMESHKQSARAAVEQCKNIFTAGIKIMKKKVVEITETITNHEKAEVSVVEKHVDLLEQEIANLNNRNEELEQISKIDDDIYFIQKFSSLSQIEYSNLHNISVNQHVTFEKIQLILSEFKSQLEDLYEDTKRISEKVPTVHIMKSQNELTKVLPSRPKTREEFLLYFSKLCLNLQSTCTQLSVDNSSVLRRKDYCAKPGLGVYAYNQTPARHLRKEMISTFQVLCDKSLSGCCYFEVQYTGQGCSIAFSYDQFSQAGGSFQFGCNNRSWIFDFPIAHINMLYTNFKTCIPLVSSKIGVFLDHSAGALSFYSVTDKMTLIHRFQTTFSEPLYPGFSLQKWADGSVQISNSLCSKVPLSF